MPKRDMPPDSDRITAVAIDGNTLMAAAVSLTGDGRPHIHGLHLLETEDLVERVDRTPHPIHISTEHLVFPQPEILSRALRRLLEPDALQNPVVGVLPPDMVDLWTDETASPPTDHMKRVRAGIKAMLDGNPYGYPKIISFDLAESGGAARGDDARRVRLWSARFEDILALADQLLRIGMPFTGIITAQRALLEVHRARSSSRQSGPEVLIDTGKLRTIYVAQSTTQRDITHAIPVGLARDDNRYFSSFVPTMESLKVLRNATGPLLIPPDYTPTGLFDAYPATPQMEITRFASNVAEYARRLLNTLRTSNVPPSVAISGLPATLPGLHEYIETRAATVIQTFDERGPESWEFADDKTRAQVRNLLPAIGGALAYLRREHSRFGIVLRQPRPRPFTLSAQQLPDMKPDTAYMMEWTHRGK